MRILIVEDDVASRRLLKYHLSEAGYEVVEAFDGKAAWELFQSEYFSIVVTDIMMPRMTGLELIEKIRALSGPGYSYIVILTALADTVNIVVGLEGGADEYLTKPFDGRELLARVATGKRILSLQESVRESETKMAELAMLDGLTHIPHRRAIEEQAGKEIVRSNRQGTH